MVDDSDMPSPIDPNKLSSGTAPSVPLPAPKKLSGTSFDLGSGAATSAKPAKPGGAQQIDTDIGLHTSKPDAGYEKQPAAQPARAEDPAVDRQPDQPPVQRPPVPEYDALPDERSPLRPDTRGEVEEDAEQTEQTEQAEDSNSTAILAGIGIAALFGVGIWLATKEK